MIRWSWWLPLLLLLPAGTARADGGEVLGTLIVPGVLTQDREEAWESALTKSLEGQQGRRLMGPAEARGALEKDDQLRRKREEAEAALARAMEMVDQMLYDEAMRQLEAAESSARDGLARLAQPKLLSEIHLLRGTALLPTNAAGAHRSMVQSFHYWPQRQASAETIPPKIYGAMMEARKAAMSTTPPLPNRAQVARAAEVLQATQLLLIVPWVGSGREQAGVRLLDPRQGTWVEQARVDLPVGATPEQIREGLQPIFDRFWPKQSGVNETSGGTTTPAKRRWAPWVAAGIGVAAAGVGTAMLLMAKGKQNELEESKCDDPTSDSCHPWDSWGTERDSQGRAFNTAGIVCLSIAGAAAVTSVVLWLLPRREKASSPSPEPEIGVGPGSVSLSVPF